MAHAVLKNGRLVYEISPAGEGKVPFEGRERALISDNGRKQ